MFPPGLMKIFPPGGSLFPLMYNLPVVSHTLKILQSMRVQDL